jgi:nucleoside-diphosphate-sugar epimerase
MAGGIGAHIAAMSRLLCLGLGYSAVHLARRLAGEGWHVTGTARTREGAEAIAALGFSAHLFDGTEPSAGLKAALAEATHVLVSIPPGECGDPVLAHHAADLARAPALRWIGYLSTVGVYGDHKGGWVDETTPTNPVLARSRARVAAEEAWRALGEESGKQVQTFRLAGIYGPGRSAIDRLRQGIAQRIVKPGQVFNRIHVEDIAEVLVAAIGGRGSHQIYNLADDEPAPPQDVVAYAAELLQIPPPPEVAFEHARLSLMAKSFYVENKRVSNARLHRDLGLDLKFPSYRQGLRAILAAERR